MSATVESARAVERHGNGPIVERALDVDSHEMISAERREEFFGHTELNQVLTTLVRRPDNHPNRSLSMHPSEYMARNLRVTPFYFEPVAMYFERYPQVADVYCYSTDYPHFEGGKDSKRVLAEALSGLPADVRDKFFYRNATLLLPH
jgi:hypothetical protein